MRNRQIAVWLLAVVAMCVRSQGQGYGPWNSPYSSDPVWTYNNIKTAQQKLLQPGLTYSPKNWSSLSLSQQFNSGAFVLAHRGLVDLYNGVPENSEAAIINAAANGVFLIELDVQATSDGVAVPLHDQSLMRPFALNVLVNQTSFASISGKAHQVSNPLDGGATHFASNTTAPYSPYQVQLHDLTTVMQDTLKAYPGITFFLDPKNLQAAQAVGRIAMNHPELSRLMVMKTYSPFWTTTGAIQHAATDFWSITTGATSTQLGSLRQMMIMPVDNETRYLSTSPANTVAALNDVEADVWAWAQNMRVLTVELPGAYLGDVWVQFSKQVNSSLPGSLPGQRFPYNTVNEGTPSKPKLTTYIPGVSSGYRFDDWTEGNVAYDWDMNGRPKVDSVNNGRRWVGFQLNAMHAAAGSNSAYITTDNPLQEVWCILTGNKAIMWGSPVNHFSTTQVPSNVDPNGDDGDQGGP